MMEFVNGKDDIPLIWNGKYKMFEATIQMRMDEHGIIIVLWDTRPGKRENTKLWKDQHPAING